MCVYVEPRRRVIMRWPGPGEIISQEAARWRKGASEWAPWLPAIKKSSRARKQFPLPAPATAAPTAAAKTLNLYYYVLAVSALCPNAFRSPPAASLFWVSRDFAHGGAVRSLAVKISHLRLTLRGFNNGKSRSSKALFTVFDFVWRQNCGEWLWMLGTTFCAFNNRIQTSWYIYSSFPICKTEIWDVMSDLLLTVFIILLNHRGLYENDLIAEWPNGLQL